MNITVTAETELLLDNLMTGVTYSFTVAAINSIGTGPVQESSVTEDFDYSILSIPYNDHTHIYTYMFVYIRTCTFTLL